MALVVDAVTYSLVINSVDRISGTNNNATYQINWQDFLPTDYATYKIAFSFQSSGGYYSDGVYSNSGPGVGATATIASSVAAASGATIITLANVTNVVLGMTVIATGVPSGTTVTNISAAFPYTVTLSSGTLSTLPIGTSFAFYTSGNVNQATFSSARVLFYNQGRSYSFDTSNKSPSLNIGILQRDIQVATSKSNSLSCFYCQSPPRSIARPTSNLLTISVMNNYSFLGGVVSYNGNTPVNSSVSTNQNFLTDTNATGSLMLTDMTPYTMLIEFIPISDSKIAKHGVPL